MLRGSVNRYCQTLLKSHTAKVNTSCRFIHIVYPNKHSTLKHSHFLDSRRFNSHILSAFFVRYASTNDTTVNNTTVESEVIVTNQTNNVTTIGGDQLPEIPDLPPPIEEIISSLQKVHPNGELAFESLGLGGYSPVGLIQSCMEWIHIYGDIPWWGTIALGTMIVRFCLFPVVIQTQRHAAIMAKYLPQIQMKQAQLSDARTSGDHYKAGLVAQELYALMKNKGASPWKSIRAMIIQAPIFFSFFLALRGMANLPVESLKTGGLWWFTDLTVSDPYYILPMVTCATLYVTIELGTDTGKAASMGNMKYIFRFMPLIILPITISFPSAILWYWTMTNTLSLVQVSLLRIPRVRDYFKLPITESPKLVQAGPKKGFTKGFKESWENMKITKQIADRDKLNTINFNEAGKGAIQRTYKYNPKISLKKHKKYKSEQNS